MENNQFPFDMPFLALPQETELFMMQTSAPLMASLLQCGEKQQKIVYLCLYKTFFAIQISEGIQCSQKNKVAILNFDQHLKFDTIQNSVINSSEHKKQYGFQLIYYCQATKKRSSLPFFHQNAELQKQWCRCLKLLLSQDGFQKKFKPLKKIGQNNFMAVYYVRRLADGKQFVVKAYSKSNLSKQHGALQRFQDEVSRLRGMPAHKNIACFDSIYESQNSVYVVFEGSSGLFLPDFLHQNKGILKIKQTKKLIRGLISGLKHLQEYGVSQRKINLNYAMISDNLKSVKILDYGLFFLSGDCQHSATKKLFPFSYPEVLEEKGKNLYEVGLILYCILTGKLYKHMENDKEMPGSQEDIQEQLNREQLMAGDLAQMLLSLQNSQGYEYYLNHQFLKKKCSEPTLKSPFSTGMEEEDALIDMELIEKQPN